MKAEYCQLYDRIPCETKVEEYAKWEANRRALYFDNQKDITQFIKKRNLTKETSSCNNGHCMTLLDTAMKHDFFIGFINKYTNPKAHRNHGFLSYLDSMCQ